MDVVSYILSTTFTKNAIKGIGFVKGSPCTIASIVDNLDGTHDITFSWKDNTDVTHTSVLTVKDGETPAFSSVAITGGHRLTFTTTDPTQSISFDVMDGVEGQRGVSVIRADVDNNNYLKLELSDGNVINAGQIKTVSMVDTELSTSSTNPVQNRVITTELNKKVNKVSGKQLSTEDFTTAEKNKLTNIENGAQVNTLENLIINGEEATIVDKKIALNIITSAVSNLQNYYLKSETYTKTEVEELIGSTVGVTIEIVQELPTVGQTNVIYFLPTETTNVYSQYIYTANDGWILIGSTSVDLSNYYTKGQVDTLLNGKQNVLTIDTFPTAMSNNPVASGGVYSAIAQMQPQFQFTNMPVASQSNYGFVYQYIGNAGTYEPNMFYRCVYNTYAGEYRWEEVIFHATVTVDSELSSTSTNPVQNKVVKEALDAKQDVMQFAVMPSAQDNLGKIVQYTGSTTGTYQNGCFYKAVYDSEHDTYIWTIVRFSADISVDNVLSNVSENPVQNKVITKKFDEYKTAFTGTEEEWDALTSEEQNVYDIMNITNDGDVLNLGIYLEKKTAMPVASEDVENRIYLYTGTTTQNYKKGVVYQCVSDGQTPATYSWVALIDFGTASIKNSTDRVLPNSTDLVESRAVYSAINTALSSIYTPRGNITCAELTSALLISDNIGSVYETSDSGTTTALFLQGAGYPIAVGSNVGVINAGQNRILFNLMPNAFDLTNYQKKDLASAVEGQTTVEGALGALSTNKASKVSSATNGDFAGLDANGNLTDSGKKASDFQTALTFDNAPTENSNNPVKSGGVYSAIQTLTNQANDMNNVYGAKNFVDIEDFSLSKSNARTKSINKSDIKGEIPNKDVILSFIVSNSTLTVEGASFDVYDINNTRIASVRFKEDGQYSIRFNGTNFRNLYIFISSVDADSAACTISNIMIRLASITDDTYEPYAKTNQQLTAENQTLTNRSNSIVNVLGAKNIIPLSVETQTINGVTITVQDDGSIVLNGTATGYTYFGLTKNGIPLESGKCILSGVSGGSMSTYFLFTAKSGGATLNQEIDGQRTAIRSTNGDSAIFDINKMNTTAGSSYVDPSEINIRLSIANGYTCNNVLIKPMIRLASITDDTYVPYAKTNQQLTQDTTALFDNTEVNGAVNMLPYPYHDTTKTVDGVTFTDNGDGTITVNGTATGANVSAFVFINDQAGVIPAGTYKCTFEGWSEDSTIDWWYIYNRTTGQDIASPRGNTFTYNGTDVLYFRYTVRSGKTVSITLKPMITVSSYNGDYVPYAKSNRELTDESELITLPATKNDSIIGSSFMVKVRKQYNAVYITGYFNTSVAANRNDLLFTISGLSFLNTDDHFYATIMNSHGVTLFAEIYPDGTVKLSNEEGMASGYYIVQAVLLAK